MTTPDTYEVRFSVRLPAGIAATTGEVEAWLRFNLRDNGELSRQNPLLDYEPEPLLGTFSVRRQT